jgi:hypothetical protein
MKDKFAFRFEALEVALRETKLRAQREQE